MVVVGVFITLRGILLIVLYTICNNNIDEKIKIPSITRRRKHNNKKQQQHIQKKTTIIIIIQ